MSKPLASLAVLAGFVAFALPTAAGSLIPIVPFPGSTVTTVFGINDNNLIVGSYKNADGVEHGYFGTLDSNYTSFDYTGNTVDGTQPRAINNDGWVVGYAPAANEGRLYGYEFVRKPDGTIVTIQKDGAPLDGIAQGIVKGGQSVGDYWDTVNFIRYGYYARKGKYQQDLTLPIDTTRTAPRGLNGLGAVVGFFSHSGTHGFVLQNGVVTQIDYPDASATATFLEAINDKGTVTGTWTDADSNSFAFLYDTTGSTFTPFTVEGATSVQVWGLNKVGLIAVDSDVGAFIYCPRKPSKCPGSGGREISLGKPIHVPAGRFLSYERGAVSPHGDKPAPAQAKNGIAW